MEQSLIKVKEALVGGSDQPPLALKASDTAAIVQGVMLSLGHKNGRVQTAALACIAPFAAALVDKSAVVPIAEQLCQALAGEPGESRENANLGLRDLTENGLTDIATAQPVVDVLVPSLATRVQAADKHALTHLYTLLVKFGTLCSASHAALQTDLFGLFAPGMDQTLAFHATRCCGALISA